MRRLDVEAHLAGHPDGRRPGDGRDARPRRPARLLRPRRRAPGPTGLSPRRRRLDRYAALAPVASRLKRAAAIAVLVGAGWLAHRRDRPVRRARHLRGDRRSGPRRRCPAGPRGGTAAREHRRAGRRRPTTATRLSAATGIDLPALPDGWHVRDMQIFPARHGTGIEIAFDAGDLRRGLAVRHPRHPRRPGDAHRLGRRRRRLAGMPATPPTPSAARGTTRICAAGREPPRRRRGGSADPGLTGPCPRQGPRQGAPAGAKDRPCRPSLQDTG